MTYYECIKQISAEEIFDGLLGFGLFSERLPPFLTSEPYLNYTKTHNSSNEKYSSQFIFMIIIVISIFPVFLQYQPLSHIVIYVSVYQIIGVKYKASFKIKQVTSHIK